MVKKLAVGLLFMTELNGKLYAVLQRRGPFDFEKMKPESFPGACQVTVHGKGKEGETAPEVIARRTQEELGETMRREFLEELGEGALNMIELLCELDRPDGQKHARVCLLTVHETDTKKVITYGVMVPVRVVMSIRPHASTGGFLLICQEDLKAIQDLRGFDKKTGVTDTSIIAMFPDEAEAVRLGLASKEISPPF